MSDSSQNSVKVSKIFLLAEFPFTGSLSVWPCVAKFKIRQRTVQRALPAPQLKFIFIKSYWPQHSTYPVQNKHQVAWQLLHLPNPAGSQSGPANTPHDGACTEQGELFGLAIWWQQPISKGEISASSHE